MDEQTTFTAFQGHRRLAHGGLAAVAEALSAHPQGSVQVFDDATGRAIDLDMRLGSQGAAAEHRVRAAGDDVAARRPGRGRPKLGVVAREVTLLPRHWDWLSRQPGGASATLRRLVEDARRSTATLESAREAQEALYRVMSALAGDLPGFEEAARALFANDDTRLDATLATWPPDVAAYLANFARGLRAARGAL